MASEVEICNLALAHLGDEATVASIDPPEGSAQAEHCARFYPIARDGLLQMHPWNFASRRVSLASVTMPYTMWKYAYACPGDMMVAVAVLPAVLVLCTVSMVLPPVVGGVALLFALGRRGLVGRDQSPETGRHLARRPCQRRRSSVQRAAQVPGSAGSPSK